MGFVGTIEGTVERWTSHFWTAMTRPDKESVEIVAVLRRECDAHLMIIGPGRTLVPNHFTVELPEDCFHALTQQQAEVERHLALLIRRHAAEQHYSFAGPVTVNLQPTPTPDTRRYRVLSRILPVGLM
ncbi:DUF3662 domain-containing protein [Streptomyces sp. A7024]|uniref:DUF3662 domain-containing protein n=1 Tax=Streptomyces coryli TaxID=1128680 RepID=A0A6G4TY67_9ACTN|nr:DUF3662 domain-containing protein [Streptomyces coryli]NGN64763.1 DUF3662 domain-containing protein [Streptomyces coryli]